MSLKITYRQRTQRKAWWHHSVMLVAIAVFVVSHLAASAQDRGSVPIPRPNPLAPASASKSANSKPTVFQKLFGKRNRGSAGLSRFTQDEQFALVAINDYLNSFRTMQGEFIQIGPRGGQTEGVFVISKPGKIRFHYKAPAKLDVISNGRTVAIRDNRAMTQDLYPLSKTPLRHLLAENTDLTSAGIVDEIRAEADLISIVIIEKSALVKGKLTLIFDQRTHELRQWIVTDAQGLNTSVAIFNTVTGQIPDPALFKIYSTPRSSRR